MAFQLTWYHKSEKGQPHQNFKHLSSSQSVMVGREDDADIVLKDQLVSRLHAEIFVDDSGVHVKDTGSSNGIRLAGKKIKVANWLPGQPMTIGPFEFELAVANAPGTEDIYVSARSASAPIPQAPAGTAAPRKSGQTINSRPIPAADRNFHPSIASRLHEPVPEGRIELGQVFQSARRDNKNSVKELFSGFLGREEEVIDCGYLGAVGFIFPEHSFWCVTNRRVCGLLINAGGWMSFNFGFIRSLDRGEFVQPSLIGLWVTVILWVLFAALLASICGMASYYGMGGFGIIPAILSTLFGIVILVGGLAVVPWVVRAYYRFVKAGCVFYTVELVPFVIFADRTKLRDAQRFIGTFMDQRRILD